MSTLTQSGARPVFHFTAQTGWINDPHGITFHDGRYHVFYQYLPGAVTWGPNCHWGHAVGESLFALTELPVAIAPGEGDDGIWTGSIVVTEGTPRAFYTSTTTPDYAIGRVRTAVPVDADWTTWRKGDFVVDAPAGLDITSYRDPFVRRDPDGWRMFLGAALASGEAAALGYFSTDLESWEYQGIAAKRSSLEVTPVWMGALWECPQIVDIEGQSAMISSVWDADVLHYAGYGIGEYADGVFDAEAWGRLSYGPSYYAPSFFRDAQGRPSLVFWMRGVEDPAEGWAGAHSVPYVLSLVGAKIVASVHPDLELLRGSEVDETLPSLQGDVVWESEDTDELVIAADDPVVTMRCADGMVEATTANGSWTMPIAATIRIILDGPVIEVSSSEGVLGLAVTPVGDNYTVRTKHGKLRTYPISA